MLTALARNLIFNTCARTIDFIKQIIISEDFIDRHRNCSSDFTRNRKLPFHILIAFLLNLVRGSYQDELDKFFKTIHRFDVAKRIVSKAALTKARMKIKFDAFIELNTHLVTYFEKHFCPRTWLGFRLVAIDGSLARLPRTKAVAQHFGVWNGRQGPASPMGRISQFFDVLNKVTIDAIISPKSVGERELAAQHMPKAMSNDLLLLDRGYPAWWLFRLILSNNANFCARISYKKWKVVRKFFRSGLSEKIIDLPIAATSTAYCQQMGLNTDALKLRLIRIENDGKLAVLITSLIDTHQYPIGVFNDLYHQRWPVEEDYKAIKCRMDLENFSGKSPLSVYQDFHAKIFAKNLVTLMAFPVKNALEQCNDTKVHKYQINFAQALSKSKGVIALLLHESDKKIRRLIADLQYIFQRTIEPIRPGRRYPRRNMAMQRKFFLQYKPIG